MRSNVLSYMAMVKSPQDTIVPISLADLWTFTWKSPDSGAATGTETVTLPAPYVSVLIGV